MKRVVSRIIKTLIFCVFFILVAIFLGKILQPKWRYPVDYEDHVGRMEEYATLSTDPKVLFMGTSHVHYGVNPMQIYEETGITSFNVSASMLDMGAAYYLLQEALSIHLPETVMLDASSLFLDFNENSFVRGTRMIDNEIARWNLAKLYAIDYVMKKKEDEVKKKERIELGLEDSLKNNKQIDWEEEEAKAFLFNFFPLYGYHSRWKELSSYDFDMMWKYPYNGKGYIYSTTVRPASYSVERMNEIATDMNKKREVREEFYDQGEETINSEKQRWYKVRIKKYNIDWLRKIKKLCDENHTKLQLFKVPSINNPSSYASSWTWKRHNAVKELALKEELPFFDILYDGDEDFDISRDFFDGGFHCNYLGAKKVSRQLGVYLTKQCGIKPDPAPDYERDLDTYHDIVRIMDLQTCNDYTEYIKILTEISKGKDVFFSTKGSGSKVFQRSDAELMGEIGFLHAPVKDQVGRSYLGVLLDGESLYEKTSDKTAEYRYKKEDELCVTILSRGERLTSDGDPKSSININGVEYSLNREGLNMVIYDRETQCVIDSVTISPSDKEEQLSIIHTEGNKLIKEYQYAKYRIDSGLPAKLRR